MTRITPAEYSATIAKLAKINERAAKRGFTGHFEIVAEQVTAVTTDAFGFQRTERMYDVTVTGEAPRYNGWTFLAALDNDQHAGLVTRMAPGTEDLNVDRSKIVEGGCDHCGIDRYRRTTYVVLNEETGEQKQVGSTCISDFLGWDGGVVFYGVDEVREEVEGGWGAKGDNDFGTDYVLAVAWATVKAFGWVPASGYGMTTKERVLRVLEPFNATERAEAEALAPFVSDAAEHAAKVRAFILSEDFAGKSEYVINLKAVAAAEWTTARNVGLLASAPQALARFENDSLIRKAKAEKPSEFFGSVGDKVEFTGTIETIRYIESQYGTSVLYQIRNSETGQLVKWFASREALGETTGVEVSIKGSIKGHEEFRGIKSTVLTRCKAL